MSEMTVHVRGLGRRRCIRQVAATDLASDVSGATRDAFLSDMDDRLCRSMSAIRPVTSRTPVCTPPG
jgi:hypothetical protein